MQNAHNLARLAGIFYLGLVLTGIFSLMYVPSQVINWEDAADTAARIQAKESLFRLGIAVSLLAYLLFTFQVLTLFRLLQPVRTNAAVIMVTLALLSVPISMFSVHYQFNALDVLDQPDVVLRSLRGYANGISVAEVFWSSWLFPFGYLVYHSGFLPRLLGGLLMAGSLCYMVVTFGQMLDPAFGDWVLAEPLRMVASVAEIGTALWLTVLGTRGRG